MSETTVAPDAEAQERVETSGASAKLAIVMLLYIVVWACTQGHFMADTAVYTQAILRHQYGVAESDYHSMTGNPFWDFGHILWRPFGWFCFSVIEPVTRQIGYQNLREKVLLTLFGINFLAGLLCVSMFFCLARNLIGDEWLAGLASTGLLLADAFLNYAHSGNAYVVGLSCLVSGMYFLWKNKPTGCRPIAQAVAAGVLLALGALFWLPYVFVLPACFLGPLTICRPDKHQRRLVTHAVVACAIAGLSVYGMAMIVLKVRCLPDLTQWILSSGHGQIQPGGLRGLARLAFSVPRSFVNMDGDGIWFKRFLVHDPYAAVTVKTLLRLSWWKLAAFYLSACMVCLRLVHSKQGRSLLFLLAASALPVFIFALLIFEAGSIERYLPLYPFVFLALGYALVGKPAPTASKVALLVALATLGAVNLGVMRLDKLRFRREEAVARIQDLLPLLTPNSLVLAVNEQDNVAEFRQNFLLDQINVNSEWRTYDVLEINNARMTTWHEDFAREVLGTWRRGGSVWLPQRFLRLRPKPDWNWVEGDDKRIHWADLPDFFSRFDTGQMVGGEDGFVFLQEDQRNTQILEPLAGKRMTP